MTNIDTDREDLRKDTGPSPAKISRRSALGATMVLPWMLAPKASYSMDSGTISSELGKASAALLHSQIPASVEERLGWTLFDAISVAVHGSGIEEPAAFARRLAKQRGGPMASIIGLRLRAPVEDAAAANAFLIHASEIDDGDLRSQVRASAVALPAPLAVAEAVDANGAQFLRAAALSYTIQGRLAAVVGPTQPFGWMASGIWGPPAAAAACAVLLKSTAGQIAEAINLAAATSSGHFQFFFDQTEEKRLIVARSARNAVESAYLAADGMRGAPRVLEGRAGLYRLFGRDVAPSPTAITANMEQFEGPLYISPKYFSASQSIIPTLEGLRQDVPEGIAGDDVVSFVVRGGSTAAATIGPKINHFEAPDSAFGAMLNFSFVVSLFLHRGTALPDDFEFALNDTSILRLANTGHFEEETTSPESEELLIELNLRDGTRVNSRARFPAANEQTPLGKDRRIDKSEHLLANRLSIQQRTLLRDMCLNVGKAASMKSWRAEVRRVAGI